jgi:hypothetical protein
MVPGPTLLTDEPVELKRSLSAPPKNAAPTENTIAINTTKMAYSNAVAPSSSLTTFHRNFFILKTPLRGEIKPKPMGC